MPKVFFAQPAYGAGCFEPKSYDAPDYLSGDIDVAKMAYESSLLAHGFNEALCARLNLDEWDEFCLLHGDVVPQPRALWVSILIAERDTHGLDAIHAPCAIKDGRGITSTAMAFTTDKWEKKRRLTTKELHRLPETFTIDDIRREVDPAAIALLPNTGCLLFSTRAAWLDIFPCFEIRNRIVRDADGKRTAQVVPEDWNFGYWAAENGLRIGATRKVTPRHVGKVPFMTEVPWGQERDEQYFELPASSKREAA